jgi:uncharacterized protein YegL
MKSNCYTKEIKGWGRREFEGRSRQFPGLIYRAKTREAASSGIRRLVKRQTQQQATPVVVVAPPPPQPTKRKVNRVTFVIDRSGSMSSLTQKSVEALNRNLETLRQKARETGQETLVTVISFDTSIEVLCTQRPIDIVPSFGTQDFRARGSTALLDATGRAILDLEGAHMPYGDVDVAYLLIVITDGEENASRDFNAQSLKSLLKRVQATDLYTCTFLLPPGHKAAFCQNFLVPEGNCMEWEGTALGIQNYSAAVTNSIGAYYTTRSLGKTSTQCFFTDLSKVTAKDVQRNLNDISQQVKVWMVEKERDIRPFVEEKTKQPFLKGAAFYQLTKDEKLIQDYKKILIKEKNGKSVYEGQQARQMIGLPTVGSAKVKPGNHANFDVFIQSTSTNRKLVRGTQLVYWPAVGVPYTEGPSSR